MLEISKYCYHFFRHVGEIEGKVAIPSGGLEVKLNLTFTAKGPIMHMMRQFLRDSYSWDYTGEQETVQQDDQETIYIYIFVKYKYLNHIL